MKRYKNRLKDLRQDKDLTKAEIAKIFYLQTTQYRRYENEELKEQILKELKKQNENKE